MPAVSPLFDAGGALAAVLGPDPRRIDRRPLLLFANKDRQVFFQCVMKDYEPKPLDGWQTGFVDGRLCACAAPQLVVSVNGRKYHADPSEVPGSSPADGHAECRACGREYVGPGRLIASGPPAGTVAERVRHVFSSAFARTAGRIAVHAVQGCASGRKHHSN